MIVHDQSHTEVMIASFTRRRTRLQRIALFAIVVVLADFGADDGCSCEPSEFTRAAPVAVTTGVAR